MSIVDHADAGVGAGVTFPEDHCPLHRLGTVRRLQGISRRTVARRMNVTVADVRRQENATDLPLSILFELAKVLEVPVAELLAEPEDDSLSQQLMQRAQLVRLMKTALALAETADTDSPRVMAQVIVDQLIEVMPELQGVSAWNAVGTRRHLDDLGITALRTFSAEVFLNGHD
jgi:transcriptional regulator with XRE-family HTH domain